MSERADIRPEIKSAVVGSRLLLATLAGSAGVSTLVEVFQALSGNTPTAEAVESCRIQLAFHAFNYIDMFPINGLGRPGKIDSTEDPKIGPAVNATVEVLDQKNGKVIAAAQLFRRPIPQDLRARILTNEFDRNNSNLTEEGYAETPVLNLDCNKPSSQVEVFIRSSQNPSDQEPRIVKNGEKFHDLLGRQEKTNEAARRAVQAFLMQNDPRRKQIEDSLGGAQAPASQPPAPAPETRGTGQQPGGEGQSMSVGGWLGDRASFARNIAGATSQGVGEHAGLVIPLAALAAGLAYRQRVPAGVYTVRGHHVPRHVTVRGIRII